MDLVKAAGSEKPTLEFFSRNELVEAALKQATDHKMKFDKISYLAKFVASFVANKEFEFVRGSAQQEAVLSHSGKCNYRALLKSKAHRLMLDLWMEANCQITSSSQEVKRIRELEYQLLVMGNRFARLEVDYAELAASTEVLRAGSSASMLQQQSASEDGFVIADTLLRFFSEFCLIENDRLVERSSARRLIIPSHIFSSYLHWRSRKLP